YPQPGVNRCQVFARWQACFIPPPGLTPPIFIDLSRRRDMLPRAFRKRSLAGHTRPTYANHDCFLEIEFSECRRQAIGSRASKKRSGTGLHYLRFRSDYFRQRLPSFSDRTHDGEIPASTLWRWSLRVEHFSTRLPGPPFGWIRLCSFDFVQVACE